MSNKDVRQMVEDLKVIVKNIVGDESLQAIETIIPTQIDILDIFAGGGFALGTFVTLAGLPHAGKSTLAIQIAANVQKLYPDAIVIYFDTENAVTTYRLQELGIDTDRLIFVSKDITIEDIFETIDDFIAYKERNNVVDIPYIVIWDSIALTTTKRAAAGEEIQNTDGMIRAKVLTEYLNRYVGKFNKYNILVLAVNQLREKIQMMYQGAGVSIKGLGNYSIPGGSIVYYASFHMLMMKIDSFLSEETYGFSGALINCSFAKNKLAKPHEPFKLVLDYDKGFSNFWTYYMYMKDMKLIKAGAWNSMEGYSKKFRTKEALTLFQTDEEFRNAFLKQAEVVKQELSKKIPKYVTENKQE